MPSGSVRARVRFRDVDGQLRRVEASAPTRKLAEHALKERLAQRTNFTAGTRDLTPDSPFGQLVELWLEDPDLEGKLAPSTRALYERNMRLVLPVFETYTLREGESCAGHSAAQETFITCEVEVHASPKTDGRLPAHTAGR